MKLIRGLVSSISFLTVIPFRNREVSPGMVMFFPVAGVFIGTILSAFYFLFLNVFPAYINIILILAIYALLTGGLHLDAFADMVDGLSGGFGNKEKILKIMDDSRIGTQGVVGLILLLALKAALLLSITDDSGLFKALLFMPAAGRWSMALAMRFSGSAKPEGIGKAFIDQTNTFSVISATVFMLLAAYLLFQFKGIAILVLMALITLLYTKALTKQIGGMTGDTTGALNEIVETASLMGIFLIG